MTTSALLPPVLFILGLLYAAGGLAVMRRLAMDHVLDHALAALGSPAAPAERTATRILSLGAFLTFASGVSLMALSAWAPWIFALNLAWQAGYLAWVGRHHPTEDDGDAQGRRATTRACLIYAGVTALVIWSGTLDIWRSWIPLEAPAARALTELGLIAAITAGFGWVILRPARGLRWNAPASDQEGYFPEDGLPPPVPKHLRLAPEIECWPTWDHETGYTADPAMLGLSPELLEKMVRWDSLLQSGYNPDDPSGWRFASVETERLWASLGDEVADQLADEWEGPLSIQISSLTYLVNAIRDGLSPYDEGSPAGVDRAAKACGVAEIRELIGRLDILAREKATLPTWDGDTMDDIARAQSLYASLLARTHPRYREDVEAGLQSPEEETRRWVRLALDGQAD